MMFAKQRFEILIYADICGFGGIVFEGPLVFELSTASNVKNKNGRQVQQKLALLSHHQLMSAEHRIFTFFRIVCILKKCFWKTYVSLFSWIPVVVF